MPLVSRVGAGRPRARLAMVALYFLLIIGGTTMVYPFLLMLSTGTKGPTDQNDNRLIPAYWSDDYDLFRKYVDDKYSGRIETATSFYGQAGATSLMSASETGQRLQIAPLPETKARAFEEFLRGLPLDQWEAGFRLGPGRLVSKLSLRYQDWLRSKYATVEAINAAYLEQNVVFQTVQPPAERFTTHGWNPRNDKKWRDWVEFKAQLPAEYRIPITVRSQWQQYLRSKYNNQLSRVPYSVRGQASEFSEVNPISDIPEFRKFAETALPERYRRSNPDHTWFTLTGQDSLPMAAFDAAVAQRNEGETKREYAGRNFRFVLDYILLHGRALWNTAAFCILAIVTHLTINPLAAYALSRFALPAVGKIMLFLLATMAFPAEVTMIPAFLLLRDLGLLNTFAALVLPTAASGFSIYLLKGFFDSLPKDYYESAAIEGAKETTMLFRIALPLSKPILAVIALTSFMSAYGAFMYAFLVAQDEQMWTLMVWIYQLQARAPKATLMAALAIAALPTLIVFLLAQRVILRGIILPGEK